MDEQIRQRYKSIIADDLRAHRPQDAHLADAIVERLFTMPQLRTETDVVIFIEEYRKAVTRGVGSELQR